VGESNHPLEYSNAVRSTQQDLIIYIYNRTSGISSSVEVAVAVAVAVAAAALRPQDQHLECALGSTPRARGLTSRPCSS
jgi:hypothetical protein